MLIQLLMNHPEAGVEILRRTPTWVWGLLTGLLLAVTAGIWLWLRPRQRDVFWDIQPHEPRQQVYPDRQESNGHAKPLVSHPEHELFQQAERNLRWQRHAMAPACATTSSLSCAKSAPISRWPPQIPTL